ncbi:hypothetical protein [Sediminibacter sp. Hel_I_10]|uniref:hypothetical protein n=1 Tax=Sediminibacter sp. Hel_I_10 TaxID=1392490 RepID=UPI00047AE526|nr:hypothetical protein [Sediminibacter sp. Hel_I_10]
MKKQLLFLSFAACLFIGSQSSFAQASVNATAISNPAQNSPQARATKVLESFMRSTDVTSSVKERVYDLFNKNAKKFEGINNIQDEKLRQIKEEKMAVYIDKQLKTILTENQFQAYLKSKS